jgi:hypothetical protein
MNKYSVTIFTSYTVEVGAESEWEAENKALDFWDECNCPLDSHWTEVGLLEGEEDYS